MNGAFHKTKITVLVHCLLVLMTSCADTLSESVERGFAPNRTVISTEQAIENAKAFSSLLIEEEGKNTKAFEDSLYVENIEVLRVSDLPLEMTRSTNIISSDTLMYVINFANEMGCVLAGADIRTSPVFAVIPKTKLTVAQVSTPNVSGGTGFDVFLANMTLTILHQMQTNLIDDICGGATVIYRPTIFTIDNWDIYEIKHPALHTNWGQGLPYNHYCNGCPTGCVAVACAQIISHFRSMNVIVLDRTNYYPLDWNIIYDECRQHDGKLEDTATYPADAIARLMRYIGISTGASYHDDHTSIDSDKALKWMNDYAGIKTSDLRKYKINDIISALQRDGIVYGRGNSSKTDWFLWNHYSGGHAWVYDGYAKARSEGKYYQFLHCNWGWNGDKNGYYLSEVFDTPNDPVFNDSDTRCDEGTKKYYQYNLQYATVCKK